MRTTSPAENMAIVIRQRCETCSTGCSVSSTTACSGQLYYCLQTGQLYDPVKAFPNQLPPPAPIGDLAA